MNYRTSHQIRTQADRLLERPVADVDGLAEARGGTVSVFNGPDPVVRVLDSAEEEAAVVGRWLAACAAGRRDARGDERLRPLGRRAAAGARRRDRRGPPFTVLGEDVRTPRDRVSVGDDAARVRGWSSARWP